MGTLATFFKKTDFIPVADEPVAQGRRHEQTAQRTATTQARDRYQLRSLPNDDVYFYSKRIDNSRVAKVTDPKRRREMITFGVTLAMLFLLVMVYLWQHFSAIEGSYRVESEKQLRDQLRQWITKVLVFAAAESIAGHVDAAAKQRAVAIQIDQRCALLGAEQLRHAGRAVVGQLGQAHERIAYRVGEAGRILLAADAHHRTAVALDVRCNVSVKLGMGASASALGLGAAAVAAVAAVHR